MEETSVTNEIMSLLIKDMGIKDRSIKKDMDLFKAGILDSLNIVRLTLLIEDNYHVKITLEEVKSGSFQNIKRIAQLICKKLSA